MMIPVLVAAALAIKVVQAFSARQFVLRRKAVLGRRKALLFGGSVPSDCLPRNALAVTQVPGKVNPEPALRFRVPLVRGEPEPECGWFVRSRHRCMQRHLQAVP
jgi:hypothetical protein